MPEILTTSSSISCPHGARAILSSSQHDLFIGGNQILIQSDVHRIPPGLCPFPPTGPRSPCVTIKWAFGSRYSKNKGTGLLTKGSVGKCYNEGGVLQGRAIISSTQTEVKSSG